MLVDERGWLWLSRRGVVVYDGQEWHPFSASLSDIDFSDTRLTYEDREGNIWIGLWGGGLVFCDPASIRRYTEADGLPDHEIRCLGEDHEGRMWIGTIGGMACMEEGQVRLVETGEIVSAMVVGRASCTNGKAKDRKRFRCPKRPTPKKSLGYAKMGKGVSGSARSGAVLAG